MRDGKNPTSWFANPFLLWAVALVIPAVIVLLWPSIEFRMSWLLAPIILYVPGVLLLAAGIPGGGTRKAAHILLYFLAVTIERFLLRLFLFMYFGNF